MALYDKEGTRMNGDVPWHIFMALPVYIKANKQYVSQKALSSRELLWL